MDSKQAAGAALENHLAGVPENYFSLEVILAFNAGHAVGAKFGYIGEDNVMQAWQDWAKAQHDGFAETFSQIFGELLNSDSDADAETSGM